MWLDHVVLIMLIIKLIGISFLIFIVSKSPIIDADNADTISNGSICNKTNSDTISSYEYNALQSLGPLAKIICYKPINHVFFFIIL